MNSTTVLSDENITRAALQSFFSLSEHWGLSDTEEYLLLATTSKLTFDVLKSGKNTTTINQDTIERISYLLGIFKALNQLLPTERAANEWLRKPNSDSLFKGQSALNSLLEGSIELSEIRRYLDAQLV